MPSDISVANLIFEVGLVAMQFIVIVPEKSLAPLRLQTYQPWPFTKEKILTTEQSVEGMKVELINLQPKLIAKNLGGF